VQTCALPICRRALRDRLSGLAFLAKPVDQILGPCDLGHWIASIQARTFAMSVSTETFMLSRKNPCVNTSFDRECLLRSDVIEVTAALGSGRGPSRYTSARAFAQAMCST